MITPRCRFAAPKSPYCLIQCNVKNGNHLSFFVPWKFCEISTRTNKGTD